MMDYKEMPLLKEMNIPYYVQIYDIIYQLIQENVLQEGDTLPGENILAEYWNVSRSTVRMAVRKLEEDGYIYKMQGKKTMVTGQLARNKDGLQHISNPCISSCIDTITKAEAVISVQNGGRLIGDLLGYNGKVFTAVAVDMKYYVGEAYVASSVAIIPVLRLEQEGIAIDEEEKLKDLALSGLYKRAGIQKGGGPIRKTAPRDARPHRAELPAGGETLSVSGADRRPRGKVKNSTRQGIKHSFKLFL